MFLPTVVHRYRAYLYPRFCCPQESFDPIVDMSNGEDLLPKMVYAEGSGDYDFQGMHAILLRYRCAATVSVRSLCTPPTPCHSSLLAQL